LALFTLSNKTAIRTSKNIKSRVAQKGQGQQVSMCEKSSCKKATKKRKKEKGRTQSNKSIDPKQINRGKKVINLHKSRPAEKEMKENRGTQAE
jgi:hypothetical protein